MFNKNANEIYINFLLVCILVINGFMLPFFYFRIFKTMIDSRRRASSYNYFKKKEVNNTFRITKGLFFSFLFFGVSYVSYFSLMLIKDYQNLVPSWIYLYLFLFARSNSVFNPVLYALTNPLFQRGFKKVISNLTRSKSMSYNEKNLLFIAN